MKQVMRVLLACVAIVTSASAAAAEVYGSVTSPPGVYYGTGNPNGAFNITRGGNIELALRAKNRGAGPVLIDGSSGIYSVAQGYCNPVCGGGLKAAWNYDFSIHTTDGSALSQYAYRLGVDHNPGAAATFDFVNPLTYWFDNAKDGLAGVQASQNVFFTNTPGGRFNVFTPGLYNFILLAYDTEDLAFANALAQVEITVQVVPEPQSVALFALGLASLAAMRRRKAKQS